MAHGRHGSNRALRFKDVQAELRELGLTIKRDTVTTGPTGSGEHCVRLNPACWPRMPTPAGTAADSAFYTPDLVDAVATGRRMAADARKAGW